ncbi:hypothetical protein [Nocardia brasiliensis]|uniref:hypothetical protein n=1 Tax=Nocardia brasiliensis TaxID=37326 RepID=UPI00245763A3|nr:hypothetical protein [Nocardia brasiliensis]
MAEYETWHVTYKRLCEYAHEDWHNYFNVDEARIVAQAWTDGSSPAFDGWADRGESITTEVLDKAEEILAGLRSCAENIWYHAGEPWPQTMAMERVVIFLRTQL